MEEFNFNAAKEKINLIEATLAEKFSTELPGKTFITPNGVVLEIDHVNNYNFTGQYAKVVATNGKVYGVNFNMINDFELPEAELNEYVRLCAQCKAESEKLAAEESKQKVLLEKATKATVAIEAEIVKAHERQTVDKYFEAVGFIAKHAKKITAKMPDYLEAWFVKRFGNVERRVVDSSKVGPSGWTEQWSLSLTIDLDTDEIPSFLVPYISKGKNKKQLANTAFIFDLMESFPFTFGKVQDIEQIRESITDKWKASFEVGFNE